MDEANWIIGYALKDDPENPGRMKDDNGYLDEDGYYYRETKDERFVNAYVVWAVDDDHDGIPDYRGKQPADPDPYTPPEELNSADHMAYITGYPDGTFQPGRNITRAELAAVISRFFAPGAAEKGKDFTDVAEGAW